MFFKMRTVTSLVVLFLSVLASPIAGRGHSHDDGLTLTTRADGTKVAVVACMDELKLSASTSYIIRNAGGRAKEALRSVMVSQKFLGTSEVYVVHHTDCRMANNSEEGMRKTFYTKVDPVRTFMVNEMEFLPIRTTNYTESLLDDVVLVTYHPLLKKAKVSAFIYNIGIDGKDSVQQV
ncbi:hypothetical protein RSOLAG22IIIB_04539 [Rhizoctonia solani]|uniref:Carbonic anhydrase n=1 Tax=Rhizoctonia solani TaxID=456999 RepID=A0A0K6FY87_9AGAM|nr:hypothetical protein RSOLAG22IIIB_04539 [Rhizoctonia solani]